MKLKPDVACSHGLRQLVCEPSRGNYLFDLVPSNLHSEIVCKSVAGVHDHDHRAAVASSNLMISAAHSAHRRVFQYKHATWTHIKHDIVATHGEAFWMSTTQMPPSANLSSRWPCTSSGPSCGRLSLRSATAARGLTRRAGEH